VIADFDEQVVAHDLSVVGVDDAADHTMSAANACGICKDDHPCDGRRNEDGSGDEEDSPIPAASTSDD
jgi:hypothetical protein